MIATPVVPKVESPSSSPTVDIIYFQFLGTRELELLVVLVAPLEVIRVFQGPPEDRALAADQARCIGSIFDI